MSNYSKGQFDNAKSVSLPGGPRLPFMSQMPVGEYVAELESMEGGKDRYGVDQFRSTYKIIARTAGDENEAYIDQDSSEQNFASVDQSGDRNEALIDQFDSADNRAMVNQSGDDNLAEVYMDGHVFDVVDIVQSGNNNQAFYNP